jgi:alpha-D-ribose 1-methylphosphonate 5-triphosphate synthase subunit PhnL
MNSEALEEISKAIVGLTSKALRLEARCDALDVALQAVAMKTGLSQEQVAKWVDYLTEAAYQKRLERIESADPSIAAELDRRASLPELPNELL